MKTDIKYQMAIFIMGLAILFLFIWGIHSLYVHNEPYKCYSACRNIYSAEDFGECASDRATCFVNPEQNRDRYCFEQCIDDTQLNIYCEELCREEGWKK